MDTFQLWDFRIIDFIDVFLVAILMYYVYKLIKGTVAVNIFIGIIIIYLVWRVTALLEMEMLHRIFDGFIKVGIIALIVVFQPEIRKFLLMVGSTNIGNRGGFLKRINFLNKVTEVDTDIDAIIAACTKMGATNTGALIVLERNNNLDFLVVKKEWTVFGGFVEHFFFKFSLFHSELKIEKACFIGYYGLSVYQHEDPISLNTCILRVLLTYVVSCQL